MSGRGFNLNDYVTVDERIDRFWELHPKPEGSIQTEIVWVGDNGDSVAIKATVYMGDRILATGIAQEERLTGLDQYGKPLKGANTSSWWENAETSAIGRAIANMGMSISKQRPSRQEMEKVQRYQDAQDATSPPANQTSAHAARTTPQPSPISRPAAAPTVAAGPPQPTDEDDEDDEPTPWQQKIDRVRYQLATIRNDLVDPKARRLALHHYYGDADTLVLLNQRAEDVQKCGLPKEDLDAGYKYHHERLSKLFVPASQAG